MSIHHILKTINNNETSQSLTVTNGILEWSNRAFALQKDIYLTKNDILINFNNEEYIQFSLPLHQDGSFKFITQNQVCHINMCLYYQYVNNLRHLPFIIQCRKNDITVHEKTYGHDDLKTGSNKLIDHFTVDANDSDILTFHIKKVYDDVGQFKILPLSYITYEVL